MSNLFKVCKTGLKSKFTVVIGSQWGDEGKGKLVDILASKYNYCARFNGGSNAGHTVVVDNKKYAFHLLPCGILYPNCVNILGNGCVVRLSTLFDELKQLDNNKVNYNHRLFISDRAHLVTEMHIFADSKAETDPKKRFLGTTRQGIGPTYSTKALRTGLRIGDLKNWETFVEKYNLLRNRFKENENFSVDTEKELAALKELRERLLTNNMIVDTVSMINKIINDPNVNLLAEGANATMLDIDFGTYPYVTSSNTGVAGVCTGLGVPPNKIETRIGVMKAYTTRVGEGPFPTELNNQIGETIRKIGHEFGATTGRPRRCGWLDLNVLKYSHMLNDYSSLNLTKLDVLDHLDEIKIAVEYRLNGKKLDSMPSSLEDLRNVEVIYETVSGWKQDISKVKKYEELPANAQQYVKRIEDILKIPISWIGTGPEREAMIRNPTCK